MLIDTHCHLDFPAFESDRNSVIERAKKEGVLYFINVGATLESSTASCSLAENFTEIYASVGIHPHDADSFDAQAQAQLKQLALNKKVVAIGETGLDYYRNLSSPENQKKAFIKQIELAKELGLPLIIHCRQADDDVIGVLEEFMPLCAVIHCFSGEESFLNACLENGFYISFTCNITYKKALELKEMVKLVPIDRLMLETDAPYLSPEGFRGKRNEPLQIKLLAGEISKIKGLSFEELALRTTQNAKIFFRLNEIKDIVS